MKQATHVRCEKHNRRKRKNGSSRKETPKRRFLDRCDPNIPRQAAHSRAGSYGCCSIVSYTGFCRVLVCFASRKTGAFITSAKDISPLPDIRPGTLSSMLCNCVQHFCCCQLHLRKMRRTMMRVAAKRLPLGLLADRAQDPAVSFQRSVCCGDSSACITELTAKVCTVLTRLLVLLRIGTIAAWSLRASRHLWNFRGGSSVMICAVNFRIPRTGIRMKKQTNAWHVLSSPEYRHCSGAQNVLSLPSCKVARRTTCSRARYPHCSSNAMHGFPARI